MVYREVAMWEILSVLERIGRGETQAAVARLTGHGRNPRLHPHGAVAGLGSRRRDADGDVAAAVFARHRPAGDRSPADAEERLLPHQAQIRAALMSGQERVAKLTIADRIRWGSQCLRPPPSVACDSARNMARSSAPYFARSY